jgi:hypothetical protein
MGGVRPQRAGLPVKRPKDADGVDETSPEPRDAGTPPNQSLDI